MKTKEMVAKKIAGIMAVFAALGLSLAVQAYEATIPAPNGVGDVVALTNKIAEFNAVASTEGGKIWLEPGVYNLSGVYMTSASHLNIAYTGNTSLLFAGKGSDRTKTVLIGGGEVEAHRVIAAGGGGNYGWTTFSNMTVTGGYVANDNGGGICGNHSTRYYDMIVSNNYAAGANQTGGGGCFGGQAYRCLFADNRAGEGSSRSAGGFYAAGRCGQKSEVGGAWNCTFTNNTLNGGFGGGGMLLTGICKDCTFYDNAVTGFGGGGVRVGSSSTTWGTTTVYTLIDGCTFVGNTGRYGGAIYGAGCIVTNCTFIGNKEDCTWGSDGGGAIYAVSSATLVDSRFYGNSGTCSPGGAVVLAAGGVISSCTFTTNSSPGSGGAVYAKGGATAVVDSTFTGNTAVGNGGAVHVNSGAVCAVTNSTFTGNKFTGNVNSYKGGVASGATLVDCTITNNTSATVLYKCNLYRCFVADNVTANAGESGVIDAAGTVGAYTNVNCLFKGNVMTSYGQFANGKVMINCTIVGNDSQNGGNYGYICTPNCKLVNCVLSGNKIGNQYYDIRPIYGQGTLTTNALDMVNCVFVGSQKGVDENWKGLVNCKKVADVKFADAANGDYTPKTSSPLYDAGCQDPWILSLVGDKDLAGNQRVYYRGIDIGAYESQLNRPGSLLIVR